MENAMVNNENLTNNDGLSSAGATPATTDRVEPDAIRVGAGGKLVVPREDFDADLDDGDEIDLTSGLPKKVRKPHRREWIALSPASELPALLLFHKPTAEAIEEEHYFVDKALRGPIRDELKQVRVFVYFSFKARTHGLWVVKVTPDNSWYESLHELFKLPAEFFDQYAIRVFSDKAAARYRIMRKPMPHPVTWPSAGTDVLLGEALGQSRFINTPDHSLYRELVEGEELR
jgi:hypothetical protein